MKLSIVFYKSPIGILEIKGSEEGISSLDFVQDDMASTIDEEQAAAVTDAAQIEKASEFGREIPGCLVDCVKQLDEYFKGNRREFDLKLKPEGTDFQKKVWTELQNIPFGQTSSYGQIAAAIGKSNACRAVGNANNRNKIAVIIPCHRVIGSDGSLVGYGGGLWRKKWLLDHEKNVGSG
jgi:methylated-DNA-[protein]-cysteine S-methyltransferase